MWHFEFIRTSAINALSALSLDPVDKLVLAHKYDVPQWIAPALNELARRDAVINVDEFNRLLPTVGLDFILKIAQVRETFSPSLATPSLKCTYCSYTASFRCGSCGNYTNGVAAGTPTTARSQHDFTPNILTTFGL
jgi:hypothetical protein